MGDIVAQALVGCVAVSGGARHDTGGTYQYMAACMVQSAQRHLTLAQVCLLGWPSAGVSRSGDTVASTDRCQRQKSKLR